MKILYLDQNKWIDLAKAVKSPLTYPSEYAIYECLQAKTRCGELCVPLSSSNIIETQKINDADRRRDLASVQSTISGGVVFHCRRRLLRIELGLHIAKMRGVTIQGPPNIWVLSNVFLDAFAEDDNPELDGFVPPSLPLKIAEQPSSAVYSYLFDLEDDERRVAIRKFYFGTGELRAVIESRRARNAGETLAMRRKIYSAHLLIDDLEFILAVGRDLGLGWYNVSDLDEALLRSIPESLPGYYTERELALRLEGQRRPLSDNDFTDMLAFSTAVTYASVAVGERQFVNLAKQAGLDKRYSTELLTTLGELSSHLN